MERPLSPDDGRKPIEFYATIDRLRIIYPSADSLSILTTLMAERKPMSQNIFDLMLVATMMGNSVSEIYTYNVDRFLSFKTIVASRPQ